MPEPHGGFFISKHMQAKIPLSQLPNLNPKSNHILTVEEISKLTLTLFYNQSQHQPTAILRRDGSITLTSCSRTLSLLSLSTDPTILVTIET